MFATWILCLFLLMIAPYLTVEAGLLRRKKCAALGAGRGYRTQLSMASQEAWISPSSFAASATSLAAS